LKSSEPILLAGTLDLLILRALIWGARHGYAIARWIKDTSRDTIEVEDRALYLALHRLEQKGFVESDWALSENNRRAKYYQLTRTGRAHLRVREATFTRYAEAVFRILRAGEAGST
jgi:PadR family transcriptional regulator PadR